MITCPKCSKDNQDHYKFCLGCGAELPRDAAPKPFSPQTPPHGMKAARGASAAPPGPSAAASTVASPPGAAHAAPAPQPAPIPPTATSPAAAGTVICPQCGHVNTPSNMFCGSCGFRLIAPGASNRPAPAPAAEPVVSGSGITLTALRADGSEAGTYVIAGGNGVIGRETGGIFASDSYLSPRHGSFRSASGGRAFVKDEGSLNGVYKKLARDAPIEIKPNDVFRIGQEIIRFEPLTPQPASPDGVERLGAPSKGYVGRLALVIGRNESGNAFPIPEAGVHLGRERGDVLFPEDGYVSGLHCRLAWEGGHLMLTDLGSSNGTFVRLKEETEIKTGDVLLMGQQLFRVTM